MLYGPMTHPGLLDVTRILEVLKRTVPIERAGLMVPTADAAGIEAPDVIPAHDGYRAALPGVAFDEVPRWDFSDAAKAEDITGVIVSALRQPAAHHRGARPGE